METKLVYFLVFFQLFSLGRGAMEGFVVGGKFTDIKRYPHAALLISSCRNAKWTCGSSVLNQRILLTAAHCLVECIERHPRSNFTVDTIAERIAFLGHTSFKEATVLRKALATVRHEHYDAAKTLNDIGLLVVTTIPLGIAIKRVVITPTFPRNIRDGYLAGWGSNGIYSPSIRLKHVYQKLESVKTCNYHRNLTASQFCATGDEDSSPFSGDSGSALLTSDRFHQIGALSMGSVVPPIQSIYTNITYYYNWITENTKKLYCSYKDTTSKWRV